MNLSGLNKKISEINPLKAFDNFATDNPTIFVEAIREQQYSGKQGTKGYKYRSLAYEKQKRQMNPSANGQVDLFSTGEFSRGIFAEVSNGVKLFSRDEKAQMLTSKYEGIWFFNEDTKTKVKPKILFKFKDYLI